MNCLPEFKLCVIIFFIKQLKLTLKISYNAIVSLRYKMDFTQLNLSDVIIKSLAKEKLQSRPKFSRKFIMLCMKEKMYLHSHRPEAGKHLHIFFRLCRNILIQQKEIKC